MKKILLDENNKLHKEIYVFMISVVLFIGAIFFTENYLSAEEYQKNEKPTESQIKERLDRAVEAGKLTQEDADKKLESILSGEVNR